MSSSELAPSGKVPLWLLVMVTLAGTLAMHMFVPALPDAARALGSTSAHMQLTITVYVIGLGVGQLFYGPLSDSLGRRPMLLIGLSLYTLASFFAYFAPTTDILIGARLVQALGGCAGLALGRAIARDTATPQTAVANLALLNLMMMMGPGIAPFVGTTIDGLLGWRAIFLVLGVMGAATALGVWRLLPETGHPTGQFNGRGLLSDYKQLLGSKAFVLSALGGGNATMCIYAFLAAAPFIFLEQLHTSKHTMALGLGAMMLGLAVGNAAIRKLIHRVPMARIMRGGNLLSLCTASVLLTLVLLGWVNGTVLLVLMLVFNFGLGLVSPTALTQALNAEPRLVGSAAGVYGFMQMGIGALYSLLVGLGKDPLITTAVLLTVASAIGATCFHLASKHTSPNPV